MKHIRLAEKLLAPLALLLVLSSCATPPSDPAAFAQYEANADPFEPLNRQIFGFNMFLDKWLIKPVAQVYVAAVPAFGREAVRNFLANLHEPEIFANNFVQTEFKRAGTTVERFAINSTIGIGGIFDVATKWGLEKQTGDLGQTLYHYGVAEGFYIVIPVLGPSNPRDLVGMVGDGFADPFMYLADDYSRYWVTYARWGTEGIDQRAQNIDFMEQIERNAIDLYAEIRSLYRQRRANDLRHGEPAPIPAGMDTLYQDPGSAPGK